MTALELCISISTKVEPAKRQKGCRLSNYGGTTVMMYYLPSLTDGAGHCGLNRD